MGADKGSRRQRWKEVENDPKCCGTHLHGWYTHDGGTWHDFFKKGGKQISEKFRPSKPKETK